MAYPPRDERDAGYLGSRAGRAGQQQSSYLKVKIDGWPIPKGRLVKGPYKRIYRDGSPSTFQLLHYNGRFIMDDLRENPPFKENMVPSKNLLIKSTIECQKIRKHLLLVNPKVRSFYWITFRVHPFEGIDCRNWISKNLTEIDRRWAKTPNNHFF